MVTKERLLELLDYEPSTGLFVWRVQRNGAANIGDTAGRVESKGYRQIGIDGVRYMAHRLVWLLHHGAFPDKGMVIDHVNGDKLDNRIENLRRVSFKHNLWLARKVRAGSKSCLLGVSYKKDSRAKPWQATIYRDGKSNYLGLYATAEEAHAAYMKAKGEYRGVAL